MNRRVLVVDGEGDRGALLARILRRAGHVVATVPTGGDAVARIRDTPVDLLVTELQLPDLDGRELMRQARAVLGDLEVVLIADRGDVPLALDGLRRGAYDFLTRPFGAAEVERLVSRALERQALVAENRRLRDDLVDRPVPSADAGPMSPPTVTIPVGMPLEDVERVLIKETLRTTGGNKQRAAELLGIAARTIYRKLG
jgi:DNA-binding NtrC family response regulator